MAARKRQTLRKRPRQERAQATVDAILQAAAYILIKSGWDGFNTNRVAERAGVNIASLYQYFPSKEAIVIELQRRHVKKARDSLPRILPELRKQATARGMLRMLVEAGVKEHAIEPTLHRVFSEELPRSAQAPEDNDGLEDHWRKLFTPILDTLPHPEMSAFISQVVAHAAIHEAASEHPGYLKDPAFVDELTLLLERYLVRPKKRSSTEARARKAGRAAQ